MDDRWQTFFEKFPETVTCEQLPVKLPRFDLDLSDLAGAAADWCQQYLKDRKCPSDLIVFLSQKVINNLRVQWAAEPSLFGYREDKRDYQALWLMQKVISELNEVCLNHATVVPHHQPILTSVWWSSYVLKNVRRQLEDYIAVIPYLHSLFDVKDCGEASFYAVYDGHNGLDAAVYSSMYLHQFLVQSSHYPTNPEHALYEAFFSTDKGFTQKTEKYNLVSGTTAVCVLHRPQEKKIYVGWVGDSIAMLWKNGTPLCLVNKHVPERSDESQRIKNEGGMVIEHQGIWRLDGQLSVSRAIGDVKYKPHITCQPEMRVLVLDGNEEFLILGSDGLWEYTTPEDVSETIYDELLETDGNVLEVGKKLVLQSKTQGSKDNISVIAVFLQDPKELVAKRRAVIMETAMEQRNATATLASYGQDTGDFGPETDVDTPDEPIGSTKPKVEGEANVIDESGEDSEEDGGGWNYYKKSTEGIEKPNYQEGDNNTGNTSDVEDMDYKLNPDAPEFVPVSSPTLSPINHTQRFLDMDNDDFISSSPQKYKESIDNVDVPDIKAFTDEIKVHAADLSKLNNLHELNGDSTMLNGIKPLNEVSEKDETVDNLMFQDEPITNGNLDKYQNPFVTDDKVDFNKVQDLSEYLHDDAQTDNTVFNVSNMETSNKDELNSSNGNNELPSDTDIKINDDFSMGEHTKYEQDMNSKNIDDTISTTNATVGSMLQLDDESFKHSYDFKNEYDGSHNDKFGQYEDRKLNDSVSTTDAILGSEPHTPMRMDNQSTFESENDDDQFSESFKQQLQFNNLDENNDKENHDPFCFEQTEDPAGIIPNVVHETNEVETQQNDNANPNDTPNELLKSELTKPEPVEEPLCVKEAAKPFHSVYEQQYLPESDFSASTHEALLNASESESNHHENDDCSEQFEQHDPKESHVDNKKEYVENQKVFEHSKSEHSSDVEQVDSDVDDVKCHAEGLKPEFCDDNTSDFPQENYSVNSVHNQCLATEHSDVFIDKHKYDEDFKQNHHDSEYIKNTEEFEQEQHKIPEMVQDYIQDSKKDVYDVQAVQNHDAADFEQEYHNNVSDDVLNKEVDSKQIENFSAETVQSHTEDFAAVVQKSGEDFEQKYNNISEDNHNQFENFKQEYHNTIEAEKNSVEDVLKQDHYDVVETNQNLIEDFPQENHGVESGQYHPVDSDEEMHSSMIIHSDVENNMPQPYCSVPNTLMSEPDMMCTSMTFEENFQNRNMSDSLYVMETSSEYFGEDLQPATEQKSAEEQSSYVDDKLVKPVKVENDIVTEAKSELVSESKIEEEIKSEITEASQLSSQNIVKEVEKQEENNKIGGIAVAAAGAAAIAAVAGVSLATKKSAPKKGETPTPKAKTTTTKTSTKPLASKTSTPPLKKTTMSTTTTKPLSRPTTASSSSTSKPITNARTATVPKTTTLKSTATKSTATLKPSPKASIPASRPTSAKTTPTTPRTSLAKTTSTSLTKTSTTPKTLTSSKSANTTPKTSTTPRTSTLVNKSPLTNGLSKPLSRPISAPAKKSLNGTTNSPTKLTNGDISKTSTATKPPITLATRMSLAPPKLPPKVKATPKTVTPPAMPGPIRRPKAPITKKTETATS